MNTHITHQKLFKNGLLFGALLLGLGLSIKEATPAKAVTADFNGPVYRLYNPNSGEHVYTMGLSEKNNLVHLGRGYEGVLGTSYYTMNGQNYDKIPVYRLYSKNSGEHLYTTSNYEVNQLKNYGWLNEGIVFYDASHYGSRQAIGIIRLYNPNSGQHFYTNNSEEAASLIKLGWNDEYTAFVFSSPLPPQSGSVSPA
ncbi:glycoside hydrolase, family 25 [Lactococcus lactis subsp. lactis]|uniref:glycoside hydrolase, family 25 n=1 Tax=Lactococcus lactis TaxID=1358 RepID=UPI00223B451F|nr:glycoside hydrolase, family 25 [Lactococcus lactis]MCT0016531.1 glycoside hydrolase, family 25 [Lactococcus lactis subsp. lactis]